MKNICLGFLLLIISLSVTSQTVIIPNPSNYPVPQSLAADDQSKLGELIPRTMNLLANGKKVKIAVYGQSLSDENNRWWRDLGDALKLAYPTAEIDIRTFGVGGVSSNLLWRLTNQELIAFSPDLVIFHVHGNHLFYETIIRQILGCTSSEMIIQGDHFGKNDGSGTAGNWNFNLTDMSNWDNKMSFQTVKGYCDTYKIERDNRRQEWYDFLRTNSYIPVQLLKDDIHLNEQGQWLVAALTARHFVYNAARNPDPNGLVKYYEVGKDVAVVNGIITLPFDGNKIEIVPSGKSPTVISAFVDGKKPSEFPNCFYFTIPDGGFWKGAPFLRPGMGFPQEEDWTITMTGNGNFSVSGSKTGNDGNGNIDNLFVSDSKKIVLFNKEDWGNYGVPITGGTYAFKSKGMFSENIDFDTISFDPQKENSINVVQNLGNSAHILELTSSTGNFPVKYIKVFKPSFKLNVSSPEIITASNAGGTVTIPITGNTFWQASHSSSRLGQLSNWNNVEVQNGSAFCISDKSINISCSIPALTGVNASEYVYIYGQGCDIRVVEIRQGIFNGVENAEAHPEILIYPNPAKDYITITNVEDSTIVGIYHAGGNFIANKVVKGSKIDMSGLATGTYLIKIQLKKMVLSRLVVKEL